MTPISRSRSPSRPAPAISVVLPTWQRAAVLGRAIASVLAQSFTDFELIVVDDGSTDSTEEAVRAFDDPRVVYLPRSHGGRGAARNAGAAAARGQALTFLDSDDEAGPEWLGRFAAALAEPRVGVVFGGLTEVRPDDARAAVRRLLPASLGPLFDHQSGLLLAGAFAVRRDLFHEVGGYDEALEYAENTELGLRLLPYCHDRGWTAATVAEPLVVYHRPAGPEGEEAYRARLEGARRLLARHGETFRRKDPRGYASYCAVAGVNAARLDRIPEARRHFRAAVRIYPRGWRHLGRFFLSLSPPLARRVWLRRAGA